MKILSAPVRSLYDLAFYREVLKAPAGRAFQYLAWLALVGTLVALFGFSVYIFPALDDFSVWMQREFPSVTWTPEGVVMNARSPYEMVHPEYGPVMIIDTTRDEVTPEEMSDVYAYVTATRFYVRQGPESVTVYDLTAVPENVTPERSVVQVDGDTLRETYRSFKPVLYGGILVLGYIFLFLTLLASALFFSIVAVLFNLMRSERLSYEPLFVTSCFAITAAAFLGWRGFLHPALLNIPFGFFGALLVTSGYLFWILKKTDVEENAGTSESA